MVNYGIITKIIGQLLFIEALMMMVCLGTSFFYAEDDVLSFLISMLVTMVGGLLFRYAGRNAGIHHNRSLHS